MSDATGNAWRAARIPTVQPAPGKPRPVPRHVAACRL